jgi:hypothetical protein
MKSKKQKNTKMIMKQSKNKCNNQRYLQNGGRLITIIFNGIRYSVNDDDFHCPSVESTIFKLKDHIEILLHLSIEQRYLMILTEDSLGECHDWIQLKYFRDPVTFTLTIGSKLDPSAQVIKIGEIFNMSRYSSIISSIPEMRTGANKIKEIQYNLITDLISRYSKRLSELRSIIDRMVKPPRVSRPGEFRINVRFLSGRIFQVYVLSTDTIGSLKIAIQEITNTSENQLRLIFNRTQLEHDRTIGSYNIVENSTVNIVLRLGGCGCGRYVCQNCIFLRIINYVNLPPNVDGFDAEVKSRFAHQIYAIQNEIIHQTHVLERLRSVQQSGPVSSSGSAVSFQQQPSQSSIGDTRAIFQMGFSRSDVLQALLQTNNNEQQAIELLLAQLN